MLLIVLAVIAYFRTAYNCFEHETSGTPPWEDVSGTALSCSYANVLSWNYLSAFIRTAFVVLLSYQLVRVFVLERSKKSE